MSAWRPNQDDASDSEDEECTFDIKGREAIVFVLDAFLFETPDHFKDATNLIRDALLSGLMVNDKDLIGLVFANTKESPAPKDSEALRNIVVPANCTLFLPLRQLNKDIVEYYLSFLEENNFNFETTYGVSECKFANMIRLCGNMFQQCGIKLSNQTIVYFTDREIPHAAGTPEFQKAIQRASDMEGQNIEFTLIPMLDDFDFEPFYKEFLSLAKGIDMDSFDPTDPKLAREMIADRKLKLDINKRCLGHVNWHLGNNVELSVKLYNYFKKSVYPQKVNLQRDDNSVVTAKIAQFIDEKDPETGDVVSRRELRSEDQVFEITCGNEAIQVSEQELLKIRFPHKPVLQLVGFKDRSALNKQHFIRPCSFIYPDDQRTNGSARLFTAIWLRCLEKEKIVVCSFIPRRKANPSFVALVPVTAADRDESNAKTFMNGDGFKVVYLPLADDIRSFNLKEWDVAVAPSEDGQVIFKKIMKKLKVKYIPSRIKDPALEELQSKLLALAFDITVEGGGDIQIPDGKKQDQRIEEYFDDFNQVFGVEEVTAKRKAPASASGTAKMPKMSDTNLTASSIDNLIATNKLQSLNKNQLTEFLKQNFVKVTSSMTKAVLIEKVLELRQNPTPSF